MKTVFDNGGKVRWATRADAWLDRFLDGTLLPLLLGVTLAAFICKIARIA